MIANLDFVKEKNISAVYKAIVDQGAISRIQIARQCRLAAGSVTRITRQLMDAGLIYEQARQSSRRGRRATALSPAPQRLQILAARAGRSHLHLGLCDLSGTLLAKSRTAINPASQAELSAQLIAALRDFLHQQAAHIHCLAGVGITTPGLVNSTAGIINFLPHLNIQALPLADQVSQALGLPCYINNFVAAMALAEHHFGVSRNCRNCLYIRVHNGVGAGMILDGSLYEGSSAAVGEIGHIQIDPLGKRCYCGNFGCLETLVSNPAMAARCHELLAGGATSCLPRQADIHAICQTALTGDRLACDLLKDAAASLGRAIAMVVNLLRPEQVVLAGELCQGWSVIQPVISHCLKSQTVRVDDRDEPQIICSALDDSPWYGGFILVRRALLEQGLLMSLI